MTADLKIRRATLADTDRILNLVRLTLGEGTIPRERSYWEWKHYQNPFGESPMLLAEAADELVGLRAFMRWQWRTTGKTLEAVRAVDTATHPDWQGRGIFSMLTTKLTQHVSEEGVHFVFNTPNDKSRPGYLKMGWRAVGRQDVWVRPLRPVRAARKAISKWMGRHNGQHPALSACVDFPAATLQLEDPELLSFLDSAVLHSDNAQLTTPRSPAYMRWRYSVIPGFHYHVVFERAGDDGALIVFRWKQRGQLLELRICELVMGAGPGSGRVARALLRKLYQSSSADYVVAVASGTREQRVLLRERFVPGLRQGPVLTVRSLNAVPNGINLLSRSQWQPSIGDLELF